MLAPAPSQPTGQPVQSDPADASHFTVGYEMWGQYDTLDGWLGDDDEIKLSQRHPPTDLGGLRRTD